MQLTTATHSKLMWLSIHVQLASYLCMIGCNKNYMIRESHLWIPSEKSTFHMQHIVSKDETSSTASHYLMAHTINWLYFCVSHFLLLHNEKIGL